MFCGQPWDTNSLKNRFFGSRTSLGIQTEELSVKTIRIDRRQNKFGSVFGRKLLSFQFFLYLVSVRPVADGLYDHPIRILLVTCQIDPVPFHFTAQSLRKITKHFITISQVVD